MKRKGLVSVFLACVIGLCGCGPQPADYSGWVPDHSVNEVIQKAKEEEKIEYRANVADKKATDPAKLTEKFLNGDADFSEVLYDSQLASGACEDLSEAISSKRTILYLSSSEGDDRNTGLSPEKPKKSLSSLTEFNSVAILLKCGDTFEMDDTFIVGVETVFGSYGEGPRPILDFTVPIEGTFVKLRGTENVWAIDLTKTAFMEKRDKLNFGQLYIDGECNWNRYTIPVSEAIGFNYGEFLEQRGENIWIADGNTGVLYLYSTEDPNGKEIRATESQIGFQLFEVNNIIVSDIEFRGVCFDAMVLLNCSDITIANCVFRNIGGGAGNSVSRSGNGITIQNTNRRISIKNNYFENIFGIGLAISAPGVTDVDENIEIKNNIFSNCYCAIKQPSDASCIVGSTNIRYENNLFYQMCDLTNPDTPVRFNINGELVNKDLEYKTYHGENSFTGIENVKISGLLTDGELTFVNNVCWGTNRVLVNLDVQSGYPVMSGNFYYADVETDKACLFEIKTADSVTEMYVTTLGNEEDVEMIIPHPVVNGEEPEVVVPDEAKGYMTGLFKRMLGK